MFFSQDTGVDCGFNYSNEELGSQESFNLRKWLLALEQGTVEVGRR